MKAVTIGRAIGLATITATGLTLQLSPAPARSSGGVLVIVAPRIGSLASVGAPAIVTPAVVSPTPIGSNGIVRAPRVDVGGVSASPAAISSAATAPVPTLSFAGVATIAPPPLAPAAAARAPRVSVGGVAVAPDSIGPGSAVWQAIVSAAPAGSIQPSPIAGSATAQTPSVRAGGVTVAVAALLTSASVVPPAVSTGTVGVIVPVINGSDQPPAPSVAAGAILVALSAVDSGSAAMAPAVSAGEARIALPLIAASSAVGSPGVAPGAAALSLASIPSASLLRLPAVSTGAVSLAPPSIASAALVRSPSVEVSANSGDPDVSTFAIGPASISKPEGNSGSTPFVYTVTRAGGLAFPAAIDWAVTGSGASPASASDFVGGSLPAGTLNFAANAATADITFAVAGDSTVENDEGFTTTISSGRTFGTITSATAGGTIFNDDTAVTYDILLVPTDSFGVGVHPREAQDTDWPNVSQWRSRAPTGVSSDITPLDQAIAPDGTDYLSIAEYIGKAWAERTGNKVLLVPHSWNGTALISNGHLWQPGDSLHEAAITRTNAAIAATGGRLAAIFPWETGLANDDGNYDNQGLTKAAAVSALNAVIASYRSKITGAANVPIILGSLVPERIASSNQGGYPGSQIFTDAISDVAVAGTGVYFVTIQPGYSNDNLHLNNAGTRFHGPLFANIVADTTAPVIATPATAQTADGGPVAITLTADKPVTWSLAGTDASAFEINRTFGTGGANNLNSTVATFTLRLAGNANASYASKASYSVTIRARDGAGNVTTKALTIAVAQPYGQGDQGPTMLTHNAAYEAPGGNFGSPYSMSNVPTDGGLALIYIYANGNTTAINSVTFKGASATRLAMQANGDMNQVWAVVVGAGPGTLVINHGGVRDRFYVEVATLSGTKVSPLGQPDIYPNGFHNSPLESTASLTCPTGGIIVGLGLIEADIGTANTGTTLAGKGSLVVAAYRKTSGKISINYSNGNYSTLNTLVWEKSA